MTRNSANTHYNAEVKLAPAVSVAKTQDFGFARTQFFDI